MKKMMNLQRLEEVRSNLNNLVSLASIIGPQDDVVAEVRAQLGSIGEIRLEVFERPPTRMPIGTQPPSPLVETSVSEVQQWLKQIIEFRVSNFPEQPKPVVEKPKEPRRNSHNHITRDIKKRGECPGCDLYHQNEDKRRAAIPVRKPEKFEIPPSPAPSRKIPVSSTYNPERYVPYRVLWAKVIIRAAYDYALWKESKDLRLKKFAQDAERWLFEKSDLELSFESICSSFDFPIERIRTRTRALTKADVKKLEFRERHGRVDPGELTSGNDG